MNKAKPPPIIDYNPHSLPPRTYCKLAVDVPRDTAGTFCERLHLRVAEKYGAAIFIPDIDNKRNTCRFEWNREWGGDRFGLRVGLTFIVGNGALTELEAYVTTKELVNATTGVVPTLPPELMASVTDEIAEIVDYAIRGETSEPIAEWLMAFLISVPYTMGFAESAEAANGRFRFVRTRIVPKQMIRLSALVVRCKARSAQAAQQKASADAMIALALLTLSTRQKYELAAQHWPSSRGFKNVVPASKPFKDDRLFPPRRYLSELEVVEPDVLARFEALWTAYEGLSEDNRSTFTPALLAYYTAVNSTTNYQTISSIGYMASLASLSKPLRRRCPGNLTCSVHGPLNWQHDDTSETAAIIKTIIMTCVIDRECHRKEIDRLVRRVHREQRSAFVHGAELRHAEFNQGSRAPPVMPSNEAATGKLFTYQDDLVSIAGLTRRTLIEWLIAKSGDQIDRVKLHINAERVTYRSLLGASITMLPKVVTRISTGPPAASEVPSAADTNRI